MKSIRADQRLISWRKSSHSGAGSGDCVEVNPGTAPGVLIRDSKKPEGPHLALGPAGWKAVLHAAKSATLDLR